MDKIFLSKIQRVGNSLAIILPKPVLIAYNWQRADYVVFGYGPNHILYVKKLTNEELQELRPPIISQV